ncbi:hypothetical protein AVEN_6155-1 [Araneus ventricosus]|uniref:Uncharacterized protein n=1 Tax=Araneus ventricosus TaxID=182803 RepID=A0A4Y2P1F2_ARAVE|nr:hypothetical protein AVEN_6155-1 [Araneus ventricosus]
MVLDHFLDLYDLIPLAVCGYILVALNLAIRKEKMDAMKTDEDEQKMPSVRRNYKSFMTNLPKLSRKNLMHLLKLHTISLSKNSRKLQR